MELIDEVMFDFPELVFVTRHGCEPWTDLAVKLMLKWPGSPLFDQCLRTRVLPEGHCRLRQHRGADKIIYAGYLSPMETLARADHGRVPSVGFKDEAGRVPAGQRPAGARPDLGARPELSPS